MNRFTRDTLAMEDYDGFVRDSFGDKGSSSVNHGINDATVHHETKDPVVHHGIAQDGAVNQQTHLAATSGALQVPAIQITPPSSGGESLRSASPLSVRLTVRDEVGGGGGGGSVGDTGPLPAALPPPPLPPPPPPPPPPTPTRRRVPRKQPFPHRSLKELVSVVDKVMSGIIVIDPNWNAEGWYYSQYLKDRHGGAISRAFRSSNKDSSLAITRASEPKRSTSPVPVKRQRAQRSSSGGSKQRSKRSAGDASPSSFDDGTGSSVGDEEGSNGFLGGGDEDEYHEATTIHGENSANHSVDPRTGESHPLGPNSRCPVVDPSHHTLPEDQDQAGIQKRVQWLLDLIKYTRFTPAFLGSLGSDRNSGFATTALNIVLCPGAGLLEHREFQLCALLRIQPVHYFINRETLVRNWHRDGYYKKSAAQKMLHIDVNKTGRLYDFLVMMGWLPASASAQDAAAVKPLPENGWKRILTGY